MICFCSTHEELVDALQQTRNRVASKIQTHTYNEEHMHKERQGQVG